METIEKYFTLTEEQRRCFDALEGIYRMWNERINVISRKDMDHFAERHVLHSLAIAEACRFEKDARVCDIGCGGGFPTVPLAILFPEVQFTAVDSVGKKITVLREVVSALGLDNVRPVNARIEELDGRFDYAVSRAVTDMRTLLGWALPKIDAGQRGTLPNGVLCLKGGDLTEELRATRRECRIFDISEWFVEPFFETKRVIYTKK